MIKEAINKIQELVVDAAKKEQIQIGDDIYTERDLNLVKPYVPKRSKMNLSSLTSLVANLKNSTIDEDFVSLPLRIIVHEQSVDVYSDLDVNYDREHLYTVQSQHPSISFNRYISVEEMIIQLQTSFVSTENKDRLIQMISNLKKDNTIELADDGVTQIVSLKSGVTSTSEVRVQPLVKLTPIRTFFEVEQPEQMFLFRINNDAAVKLEDAGGGVWKYNCQEAIRAYLHAELEKYVELGHVVIG